MQAIKKIGEWLVYSSADPEKFGATLKGSVIFVILSGLASALHFNGVTNVLEAGVNLLVLTGQIVSAVYALYGALRKVTRTVLGNNKVINQV